jgi:hypothetical protein
MDRAWWQQYQGEVRDVFRGELWAPLSGMPGVRRAQFARQDNSGAGAIALAASLGAGRILLLGYDAQKTNGKAHWHADHPKGLGNAGSVRYWPQQFRKLAQQLPAGVSVVNASRVTALDVFPRANLQVALGEDAPPLRVEGMHGMGDNLHQRSLMRELMKSREVWLDTPWPSIYHDLVGSRLHVVSKGSKLRTQAKNVEREASAFDAAEPPKDAEVLRVSYPPEQVRRQRGVLAAMSAHCGLPVGDFRMPVPDDWTHGLRLPKDRPVLVLRPLVERTEWGGCRNRNPESTAYLQLLASIRERFFLVSVADLQPGVEWLAHAPVDADLTLHAGELDFRALAALWRDASLVFTSPGFGLVLAQAVGTPVVGVFGGYESGYSFSAGAVHTPTLTIEPRHPCDCFSHTHRCSKAIDMALWLPRLASFADAAKKGGKRA